MSTVQRVEDHHGFGRIICHPRQCDGCGTIERLKIAEVIRVAAGDEMDGADMIAARYTRDASWSALARMDNLRRDYCLSCAAILRIPEGWESALTWQSSVDEGIEGVPCGLCGSEVDRGVIALDGRRGLCSLCVDAVLLLGRRPAERGVLGRSLSGPENKGDPNA